MNASFHRSEQDFRATIARGALRARPVVTMSRKRHASRWTAIGVLALTIFTAAMIAGGAL